MRVYAIFDIEVQFFDIKAQNLTFDIDVLSSISKVLKENQHRVRTFDIDDVRYRVL
jgi:hypothetical protein